MSKQQNSRSDDWTRCSEGFLGLSSTSNVKQKERKSVFDSFSGHGNIFEKLGLAPEEESSQNITWSSNESEGEGEINVEQPVVQPPATKSHNPTKKRKRQTPVRKSQAKRRVATKGVTDAKTDFDDIRSDSDTDKQDASRVNNSLSTPTKSQEASIKSYDSGPEEEEILEPGETIGQTTPTHDDSPDIVEGGSCELPETQSTTLTGTRASDWIKSLQLKTPSKTGNQSQPPETEDSAKKKKKPSRGGLADQLGRVQARDKSAVRIWNHQQNKPSLSQDSKSLTLKVVGFESLYSMQLVKCVCSSDEGSESCDTKLVMLPASQADQLDIHLGTLLTIYPPWQQLELNDGQQILLCTKYCRVAQPDGLSQDDVQPGTSGLQTTERVGGRYVKATWNCPCVQGLCRSETLCPAYQFPCVPGLIPVVIKGAHICSTKSDLKSVNTDKKVSSHLQTISTSKSSEALPVTESSSCLMKSESSSSLIKSESSSSLIQSEPSSSFVKSSVCDSLLESIEASKTSTNKTGDHGAQGICFKGHVHRFLNYKEGGQKSHVLLVEDGKGTLSEVRLSLDTVSGLNIDTDQCEGQTLQFTSFSIQDRLTRDNQVGLFSLIDHVWSGRHLTTDSQDSSGQSQDSVTINQNSITSSEPQGFCYILHPDTESPTQTDIQPCQSVDLTLQKDIMYKTLASIQKLSGSIGRCSCVAKLIYIDSKRKDGTSVLYIVDKSIKTQVYMTIHVQSSCYFTHNAQQNSGDSDNQSSSDSNIHLLRDLLLYEDKVYADKYCCIRSVTDGSQLNHQHQVTIPSLSTLAVVLKPARKTTVLGDLCTVKGVIEEVDEDSAYSWEMCNFCRSDELHTDTNTGKVMCVACKKIVDEAITNMKMEVVIHCDSLRAQVKVDLLQSTIEQLLPQEEDDDEGYEITSVLNKTLGPIPCLVDTINTDNTLTYKMAVREIQLLK